MILVVLGTHELPFVRLLQEVERLKEIGVIDEEIVVQHGHTPYQSDRLQLYPFVSFEEMERLYDQARLIITHAGSGSVMMGIRKRKTVIAAPRLKKYGEHNDDHQLQLAGVFATQGHILVWNEGDSLESTISKANHFTPVFFQSGREKLEKILTNFIDQV